MKTLLALAVVAGMSFAASVSPAQADSYKWCAVYSGNAIDGSVGCWFTSLEQCQATVTGLAGFCRPNTLYSEPGAVQNKRINKKRVS